MRWAGGSACRLWRSSRGGSGYGRLFWVMGAAGPPARARLHRHVQARVRPRADLRIPLGGPSASHRCPKRLALWLVPAPLRGIGDGRGMEHRLGDSPFSRPAGAGRSWTRVGCRRRGLACLLLAHVHRHLHARDHVSPPAAGTPRTMIWTNRGGDSAGWCGGYQPGGRPGFTTRNAFARGLVVRGRFGADRGGVVPVRTCRNAAADELGRWGSSPAGGAPRRCLVYLGFGPRRAARSFDDALLSPRLGRHRNV